MKVCGRVTKLIWKKNEPHEHKRKRTQEKIILEDIGGTRNGEWKVVKVATIVVNWMKGKKLWKETKCNRERGKTLWLVCKYCICIQKT